MKVLKHGNTYLEIECDKCGALLGCSASDIYKDFYTEEMFGMFHTVEKTYFTCPECGEKIYITYIIDGEDMNK